MTTDTKTTTLGALAGALTYWGQTGFAFPKSKQEFAALLGSATIVALGYFTNKK